MLDAMRKAGCTVDRSFFRVETCEGNVVGGFRPPDGVRSLRAAASAWRAVAADARARL
jgi:hypothetical protein